MSEFDQSKSIGAQSWWKQTLYLIEIALPEHASKLAFAYWIGAATVGAIWFVFGR